MSQTSQGELFPPAKPTEPPQRGRRSVSQMTLYFACGEAYRRRYIEKEKIPAGIEALVGSAMHAGAEANFKQKLESHVDLPRQQIIEAAIAGFNKRLAEEGAAFTDEQEAEGRDVVIDRARNLAAEYANAFAIYQAPHYQPKAVEQWVVIPVPRGPNDIVAVLDLVTTDDEVRDFKNSKRTKSSISAAESVQLTMYAAAHAVKYGKPAKDVGLDILVHTTKGVKRQVLTDQRDAKDFTVLANRLNVMEKGISTGVFLPANPGDWKCSKRWCEYFTTCPYVNAERIAAAQAAGHDQ
jgi:hypothetical protein